MTDEAISLPDVSIRVIDSKRYYQARLSKDGRRVRCGHRTCRGELGLIDQRHVGDPQGWDQELGLSDAYAVLVGEDGAAPRGAVLRVLTLPPGWWRGDDGVWYLTKYAEHRLRNGKSPKYRQERDFGELGRWQRDAHVVGAACIARCPDCRHLNLLDPMVLTYATEAHVATLAGLFSHDNIVLNDLLLVLDQDAGEKVTLQRRRNHPSRIIASRRGLLPTQ